MSDKARLTPLDRPNSYVGRSVSREGARRAVAGRGTLYRRHLAAAHAARRLRAQPAMRTQKSFASTSPRPRRRRAWCAS